MRVHDLHLKNSSDCSVVFNALFIIFVVKQKIKGENTLNPFSVVSKMHTTV